MTGNWFYEQNGSLFVPTELTRGPWDNNQQHGGPPAALLGRAIERFGPEASELFTVRLTFDFFRPVPLAPLEIHTTLIRSGKTVDRIEATLTNQQDIVMRASGLRLRRRTLDVDAISTPPPIVPTPDQLEPLLLSFFQHERGYHRAVEVRFAKGKWGEPSVIVWMRTLATLIRNEPTTPLERLLIMVDAESGICPPLDPQRFTFLNPDLNVFLERSLQGEWIGLSTRSSAQPHGIGLSESALFDDQGIFGGSAQSLVLAKRKL